MMGCVPVDMSGKAIRPAIIWADQRSTAQADRKAPPVQFKAVAVVVKGHAATYSEAGPMELRVTLRSETSGVRTWRLYLDGNFKSEATAVLQ